MRRGVFAVLAAVLLGTSAPPTAAPLATTLPSPAPLSTDRPAPYLTPPLGWEADPGATVRGATVLGAWHTYAPTYETLLSYVAPNAQLTSHQVASAIRRTLAGPGSTVVADASQRICGHAGWRLAFREPNGVVDQLLVDAQPSHIYTLALRRGHVPDPAAEAAIATYCPPREVAVPLDPTGDLIDPPKGWTARDATSLDAGQRTRAYLDPAGFADMSSMLVTTTPTDTLSIDAFLEGMSQSIGARFGGTVDVVSKQRRSFCGLPGWLVEIRIISPGLEEDNALAIVLRKPVSTMANYTRRLGSPYKPEAMRALLSLCPQKERVTS